MSVGGGRGERASGGGGGRGIPYFFSTSPTFCRLYTSAQDRNDASLKNKSERGGGRGGGGRESRTGVKCEGGDGKSHFALSQSGPPCCRTNVATDCTQRVISDGSYAAVFL